MKIIYNNWIPFPGFLAMNFCGMLFVRNRADGSHPYLSEQTINHETIHTHQMQEMGYLLFYIWYVLEWFIRLFMHQDGGAYRNISFEREAYSNEHNLDYLKTRPRYAWLSYLKK